MNSEIIKKIVENLKIESSLDDKPVMSEGDSLDLSKENFKQIIKSEDSGKKVAFVDGGNTEILKAANFSLQFIRIFACTFQNNKRISQEKNEFYILIRIKDERFDVELYPLEGSILIDKEHINLSSTDSTITQGVNRADIYKIGEIARRFAELAFARTIDSEIIVIDGSLQKKITNEDIYLNSLFEKQATIAGLSKTTSIFTEKGNSITNLLNTFGPKQPWYYHPIVNNNNSPHIYFTKLNEKNDYVFKFEVHGQHDIQELLSLLSENASDPVFLGYPYGLVIADKLARVSNQEREYLLTMLMSSSGEKWKDIKKQCNSVNAHSILDNIH